MEQAEKKSQGKAGPLRNEGDNQITNTFIMATLMNCYLIPVTQKKKDEVQELHINKDPDNRVETVMEVKE